MKLLSTDSNSKVVKTNKKSGFLYAGLSLMPDSILCPWSKTAECFNPCLKISGMAAVYKSVNIARQKKSDYYHNDKAAFFDQLRRELFNLEKRANKQGLKPAARLNVLSDIPYEKSGIIEEYPNIHFVDYTKNASRLGKTPENYHLIFSYSGAPAFQKSNEKAFLTDAPIAVVFSKSLPLEFNGRKVIDGDNSDIFNASQKGRIVGLIAKGEAAKKDDTFVVNSDLIARA